MQQMYSCPNCGSLVEWGQKFCANCGASFDWDSVQDASQSSYDYGQQDIQYDQQYNQQYYQQQEYQQADWNQYYPGQQDAWGNVPPPYPQQGGRVIRRVPRKKRSSNILMYLAIFLGVVFVGSAVFLLLGEDILSGANSNQDGQSVAMSKPAISFTAVPDTIQEGESADLSWDVNGATSITIDNGIGAVSDTGLQTVSPSETTVYTLTASNSVGTSTRSVTVTVEAAGVPKIVSFTAAEDSVDSGGSATLQWEVQGADTVTLNGEPVSASGSKSVFPSTSTTYTLVATNGYGDSTRTTTVTVIASSVPQITSFSASPASIASGGSSTLSWVVTGADTVEINQGVGSVSAASGSETVSPTTTTTYTLTATNSAGSSTATTKVTIGTISTAPPAILSFTASPLCINADETTTLYWKTSGATKVEINGVEYTPVSSGNQSFEPIGTTPYIIEATTGNVTVSDTLTVVVAPEGSPTIEFTASPRNVCSGQPVTLEWDVHDATSVTITPGIGLVTPTSGSLEIYPNTNTTYYLTADNDDTDPVTVQVKVYVSTGFQFTASPNTIIAGNKSTLNWSILGASSVYAEWLDMEVLSSGTDEVYPTEDTEYTLTANSIVLHATVKVIPANSPTISSFTATPVSGDTYRLEWQISNATSANIGPIGSGVIAVSSITEGSREVDVNETTTFILTATNSTGSVTKWVTVTP